MLLYSHANAQPTTVCTVIGQNPISAFPVCGSNVFSQTSVPLCGGKVIPVIPCKKDASPFTDINPFWYKFTCYKTGTLGFSIVPINRLDDYDWQLFDVTNDSADIYKDASLIVACNWSGRPGTTGTGDNGKNLFECGDMGPLNISAKPTILKDHKYLLLVSHFTDSQIGYNLSFDGSSDGSAVITDTLNPNIKSVLVSCDGSRVKLKLNKKMLCSSIVQDGSDFAISTNPIVDSVRGWGCRTGFDTDSVVVYLNSPLPTGDYQYVTKLGNNGSTMKDICGTSIPLNETFTFTKLDELPTPMDSITTPLPCMPQQLKLVFKRPIRCNSVAPDGSDFEITGPLSNPIVSVASATTDCDSNGISSVIYVNLSIPINSTGKYRIKLKQNVYLSTIINECSIPTPLGTALDFNVIAKDSLSARFNYEPIRISCKVDSLAVSFFGMGPKNNNATGWQWFFNKVPIGNAPKDTVVYTDFTPKPLTLIVTNGTCIDTNTTIITPIDTFIKAGFIYPDTICPTTPAMFTDTSKSGKISIRDWTFGNGNKSTDSIPAPQYYPTVFSNQTYNVQLVVTNRRGCSDTAKSSVVIRTSKPNYADSITKVGCADSIIQLVFKEPILSSSIKLDGSNFTVNGPDSMRVLQAKAVTNGLTSTNVNISFSSPIKLNGIYTLSIHKSISGDSIVNACHIRTPDTILHFTAAHIVLAHIKDTIHIGCKQDTLLVSNTNNNRLDSFKWTLDNNWTLPKNSGSIIYNNFSPMQLSLRVWNDYCADTSIVTVIPASHDAHAVFNIVNDTICPNATALFTNQSQGILNWWKWNFGNNVISLLQNPPAISYPSLDTFKSYKVRLIVKNSIGCYDTSGYLPLTVRPGNAAKMDSVLPIACAPKLISLQFNKTLVCNSLDKFGSNFNIIGPSSVLIDSANVDCKDTSFNKVRIYLHAPILVSGNYLIRNKLANNGTSLLDECDIPTLPGNSISFIALNAANAAFDTAIVYGCKVASVKFSHNGANAVNKWQWYINDTLRSISKDTLIKYTDLSPKSAYLIVANHDCGDTSKIETIKFINETDTVKANFSIQKLDNGNLEYTEYVCPKEIALLKDSSEGIIKSWFWNFGDGQISTSKNPPPQTFPRLNATKVYPLMLAIEGNFCKDTVYNNLKVIPNCYIAVPSAFTPGEIMNNRLYPLNAYKADNLMFRVYNRFGQLVFQTSNWTRGWDGTFNGISQGVGTYVWTLHYIDHDSKEPVSLSGTSVLLK